MNVLFWQSAVSLMLVHTNLPNGTNLHCGGGLVQWHVTVGQHSCDVGWLYQWVFQHHSGSSNLFPRKLALPDVCDPKAVLRRLSLVYSTNTHILCFIFKSGHQILLVAFLRQDYNNKHFFLLDKAFPEQVFIKTSKFKTLKSRNLFKMNTLPFSIWKIRVDFALVE